MLIIRMSLFLSNFHFASVRMNVTIMSSAHTTVTELCSCYLLLNNPLRLCLLIKNDFQCLFFNEYFCK